MKRRIAIGATILGVVAAAAVAVYFAVPRAVAFADAEQREIVERLVATGQVDFEGRTALNAEVSAPVVDVAVQEGDDVEAGDILARFDDEEGRRSLEQARAGVEQARARLRSVDERGAPTALEDLRQASLALEAALEEYERAQNLLDAGVITGAEVDERRREVERAESRLEQAEAAHAETTEEGSSRDEAAAELARAEAERQLARHRLEDYTVRAPRDGTILTREVDPGAGVQPGTPIVTIAPTGPVDLRLTPDERELSNLETGQSALATTDAYPDRSFEATVHRIAPVVDPERGTITVYLRVDTPPDYLRPDMTVTADIEVGRRDEALVVPVTAVREADSDAPWVVQFDGRRARRTDVDVGLRDDEFVEITAGLDPGETVVADAGVDPGDRIRPGERLDPDTDEIPDEPTDAPQLPDPPRAAGESPGLSIAVAPPLSPSTWETGR